MMRVRVVKSQIAGTATRTSAQLDWRAAMTSTGTAAQYAAPRNAAVMGGLIVHAKYVAVCSENTVSWKPARKTRTLAAYRSHFIMFVSGRMLGDGPGLDTGFRAAGNERDHKEACRTPTLGIPSGSI